MTRAPLNNQSLDSFIIPYFIGWKLSFLFDLYLYTVLAFFFFLTIFHQFLILETDMDVSLWLLLRLLTDLHK